MENQSRTGRLTMGLRYELYYADYGAGAPHVEFSESVSARRACSRSI